MELNFTTFAYLFLRLAPFILVCFFTMGSIFNQDFKGFVYLIGLLFACFCSLMLGRSPMIVSRNAPDICKTITIGGVEMSALPIGQTVFGYTFAYLLYVMIKNNLVLSNIPVIVFLSLLILFDAAWNITKECYTFYMILAGFIVGGGIGALWSYIIDSTNTPNLQYYTGISNKEVCSRPARSTFKCNVYKGGKLISTL